MGTRGAYGFRVEGQDKVTYNHFDSYPEGLGDDVVEFIKNHTNQELGSLADSIVLVKQDKEPTKKQIKECMEAGMVDLSVSKQSTNDWYCLLRNAQGNLDSLKKCKFMIDSHEFLNDSLFCEYAYIINMDSQKLEVYGGFNKNPDATGRYAGNDKDSQGYCGVVLFEEVDLDKARKAKKYINRLSKRMNKE